MTNKRMTTQGLGHEVSRIVDGGNTLQVDLLALNCITNEVKLDPEMASPERCLSRGSNLQTCLLSSPINVGPVGA